MIFIVLILLPLFFGTGLFFWGSKSKNWRLAFILAYVTWSTILLVITEVLSGFNGIRQWVLILIWSLILLACAAGLVLLLKKTPKSLSGLIPKDNVARLFGFLTLIILLIVLVIALIAPPNTWDSLAYHMSRVAHWAQNQSISHFPTGIPRQNSHPPGTEIQILQFYVITQSDQFSNLVSFFGFLTCILGSGLIADLLGANSRSVYLSSLLAATLPMAIAQASSTKNDLVAAGFAVCAVSLMVWFYENPDLKKLLVTAAAAGLALLTKPTVLPVLAVFLPIPILIRLWQSARKDRWIKAILCGVIALTIVLAVNSGFLYRNIQTYDSMLPAETRKVHVTKSSEARTYISGLIKNTSAQLTLPEPFRSWIERNIINAHIKLGWQDQIRTFRIPANRPDESTLGNPVHALAAFISLCFILSKGKKHPQKVWFGVALVISFLLFSAIFKWHIYISRHQLPWIVMVCPFIGLALTDIQGKKRAIIGVALIGLTIINALPALFTLEARPLIADPSASILTTSRKSALLQNQTDLLENYSAITQAIRSSKCRRIALNLPGNTLEYVLWSYLGMPGEDYEIRWLVSGSSVPRSEFQPCLTIIRNDDIYLDLYPDAEILLETPLHILIGQKGETQ
jgi:hypothetical protein